MPLVTTLEMLQNAQENSYAVGAFNIENMEMAQAVVAAAEEMRAPVIVQTTCTTVRYASAELYFANVSALAKGASVPVALHLDHGDSFELTVAAVKSGYTSVMIDGSGLSLEDNSELTRRVVTMANLSRIPVEAELGKVGGKEDDADGGTGGHTDPIEAKAFAEKTGISSLAVAIGTAHGVYSKTPKLDVNRLIEIRKRVDIPLVLHGASGLLDSDIVSCIKEGICKVNFATELRVAYSDGIKEVLRQDPSIYDPKKYGTAGREKVKQICIDRMKVCGCAGRC